MQRNKETLICDRHFYQLCIQRPRTPAPLERCIGSRGLVCFLFWGQQIPVGKNWRRNIFEHLRAARCVIVAWSSASIESDWVSEEAADALKHEVLLPIYIDQVEPSFGFADIQTMNLVGWSGEEGSESFHRLVSEVTRIVGASHQPSRRTDEPARCGRQDG